MSGAAKRTNERWLADLRAGGASRESALSDLRAIILSGLPYALAGHLPADDPQFEPLAEEVAQETLLRVLDRLDTFEGRSQFTTWVHTIAVRLALSELRHRKWRDVSLDDLTRDMEQFPAGAIAAEDSPSPELAAVRSDMLARVERIISEELTDKQRRAMQALALQGMPLEEVALRMHMNRNALYKLMHDARLRVKQRMEREGLNPAEVLTAFEQR